MITMSPHSCGSLSIMIFAVSTINGLICHTNSHNSCCTCTIYLPAINFLHCHTTRRHTCCCRTALPGYCHRTPLGESARSMLVVHLHGDVLCTTEKSAQLLRVFNRACRSSSPVRLHSRHSSCSSVRSPGWTVAGSTRGEGVRG